MGHSEAEAKYTTSPLRILAFEPPHSQLAFLREKSGQPSSPPEP